MPTLTPTFTGSFNGEMVYNMTNYQVPDFATSIDSIQIVHRNKFINKMTGFETVKYVAHKSSGDDVLVDISITLVGDLRRSLMQQFRQLAKGVLGAGMELIFHDDLVTDYDYTCRWVNACNFVENSTLLCGGDIVLESWTWSAI